MCTFAYVHYVCVPLRGWRKTEKERGTKRNRKREKQREGEREREFHFYLVSVQTPTLREAQVAPRLSSVSDFVVVVVRATFTTSPCHCPTP